MMWTDLSLKIGLWCLGVVETFIEWFVEQLPSRWP